jgi:hypothetical protein
MKMNIEKIAIVGAGSRVRSDILPVCKLYYTDIKLYAQQPGFFVDQNRQVICIYELDDLDANAFDLIIVSVPNNAKLEVIDHLNKSCYEGIVLVDTPYVELDTSLTVRYLEDVVTSPLIKLFLYLQNNILISSNFLFKYHGQALISKTRIKQRHIGYFSLIGNVIFVGKRNYKKLCVLTRDFRIQRLRVDERGVFVGMDLVYEFDEREVQVERYFRNRVEIIELLKIIGLSKILKNPTRARNQIDSKSDMNYHERLK